MGMDILFKVFVLVELLIENECKVVEKVFEYMGFIFGILIFEIFVDYVFIGFCMNGWIEDLCVVVKVVKGYIVFSNVIVIVVFGLGCVKI